MYALFFQRHRAPKREGLDKGTTVAIIIKKGTSPASEQANKESFQIVLIVTPSLFKKRQEADKIYHERKTVFNILKILT